LIYNRPERGLHWYRTWRYSHVKGCGPQDLQRQPRLPLEQQRRGGSVDTVRDAERRVTAIKSFKWWRPLCSGEITTASGLSSVHQTDVPVAEQASASLSSSPQATSCTPCFVGINLSR